MGLDTIELILRVEDTFGISLPDEECSFIHPVGDLFRLVLTRLKLEYESPLLMESQDFGLDRSHHDFPGMFPWTTPDVWETLQGVIMDQLQVDRSEIGEETTFLNDLGCE